MTTIKFYVAMISTFVVKGLIAPVVRGEHAQCACSKNTRAGIKCALSPRHDIDDTSRMNSVRKLRIKQIFYPFIDL
jgi:hypothetical protein